MGGGWGCWRQPELKWQVSRGQSDTGDPVLNMNGIRLAISEESTSHIFFQANFSGVNLPPVLQCIILLTLFCVYVEEIQLRCKGTLQFSFSSQSVSLLF